MLRQQQLILEQEIQKSYIKPSHKTDQFAYLKQNTLEWSDVTFGGNVCCTKGGW